MGEKMAFSSLIGVILCLMSFPSGGGCVSDGNCQDKPEFTPSRLVVKFGDPANVTCSVSQHVYDNAEIFGLEIPIGEKTENGRTIDWTVEKMTEWDIHPQCFHTRKSTGVQCVSKLPVTVYKPLSAVSLSFVDHTGPMLEGLQYTLQCTVEDVAPVKNLNVTFYRGQTALDHLQSNKTTLTPQTETFTLNITASKEDDGVQYRCEAKLDLGHEGPQPPPVVTSQTITATVHYKPQFEKSNAALNITLTEGERLELNCSAVGNPSPSYTWKLPSSNMSCSSSSLIIDSVTSEHDGEYICSVNNTVGNVKAHFRVNVKAPPGPPLLIIIVALAVVVLLVIVAVVLYRCYKHNRMGKYNLKKVIFKHTQHTAVPIAE